MSMVSMAPRSGREAGARSERRTRRRPIFRRIGMISMIPHGQIAMRNTRIAMKRYQKSESGKIDFMRIEWLVDVAAIVKAKESATDLR